MMASIILSATVLVLIFIVLVFSGRGPGRRIEERRSVLVHAGPDRAWAALCHLPDVLSRHSKTSDYADLTTWTLCRGDGRSAGSVWRAEGTWAARPYWFEAEIIRVVPQKELSLRLRRDAFGTERGLREHHGTFVLDAAGPDVTKITWRLRARLRGIRLLPARLAATPALRARLLDQGLRSLKAEIDFSARDRDRIETIATASAPSAAAAAIPTPPGPDPAAPETTV